MLCSPHSMSHEPAGPARLASPSPGLLHVPLQALRTSHRSSIAKLAWPHAALAQATSGAGPGGISLADACRRTHLPLRALKREPLFTRLVKRLDLQDGKAMVGKTFQVVLTCGRKPAGQAGASQVQRLQTPLPEQRQSPLAASQISQQQPAAGARAAPAAQAAPGFSGPAEVRRWRAGPAASVAGPEPGQSVVSMEVERAAASAPSAPAWAAAAAAPAPAAAASTATGSARALALQPAVGSVAAAAPSQQVATGPEQVEIINAKGLRVRLARAEGLADAVHRRVVPADERLGIIERKLNADGRVWLQELSLLFRVSSGPSVEALPWLILQHRGPPGSACVKLPMPTTWHLIAGSAA